MCTGRSCTSACPQPRARAVAVITRHVMGCQLIKDKTCLMAWRAPAHKCLVCCCTFVVPGCNKLPHNKVSHVVSDTIVVPSSDQELGADDVASTSNIRLMTRRAVSARAYRAAAFVDLRAPHAVAARVGHLVRALGAPALVKRPLVLHLTPGADTRSYFRST